MSSSTQLIQYKGKKVDNQVLKSEKVTSTLFCSTSFHVYREKENILIPLSKTPSGSPPTDYSLIEL